MADTNIVQVIIKAIDETKGGLTTAIRNASDLETQLARLKPAAAAAAVAIAAAFGMMVKSSIDAADEASKLSQKVGVMVEDITTLDYASKLAGSALDGLRVGFKTLAQFVTLASQGSKENQRLLDSLNLSYKNADGTFRSTKDVLFDIADQFKSMPDGIQKSDAAVRLLGKSGLDLIPLLNSGSEGIRELQEEARAFGLEVSGNTARAAENFNDNLSRLNSVQQGVGNYLAEQFLPILNDVTNEFIAASKETSEWAFAADAAIGVIKTPLSAIIALRDGFASAGKTIGGLSAVLTTFAKDGKAAGNIALAAFGDEMEKNLEKIKIRQADLWVPDGASVSAARAGGREIAEAYADSAAQKLEQEMAKLAGVLAQKFGNNANFTKSINDTLLRQSQVELDQGVIDYEQFYDVKARLAASSAKAEIDALDLVAQARERKLATLTPGSSEYEAEAVAMQKAIADRMAAERAAAVEQQEIDNERQKRIASIHMAEMDAIAAREQAEEDAAQRRSDFEFQNYERSRDLALQLEAEKLQARMEMATSDPDFQTGQDGEAVALYYEQRQLLEDAYYEQRLRDIAGTELSEEESLQRQEAAYEAYLLRKRKLDQDEEKARRRLRQQELGLASDFFGNLAEVAKLAGKKGFAAYKAFATAQAIIATYSSAVKAYDSLAGIPIVGPALGAAAAAAAIAFGIARVQQINSAQPGGGAAHGGLGYVPQETTYLLERGERVLSPNQNSDLTRFIQEQGSPQRQGEVVVNVSGQPLFRLMYEASRNGELKFDARSVV